MTDTIRALLFDLDDTLYSRSAAFRKWAQDFVRDELGLKEDDQRYQAVVESIIDLDEKGYSPRETLFAKIKAVHAPVLQNSVEQLIVTYNRRFLDYIHLEAETQRFLTALKRAGLPFGIVTNGATTRQLHRIRTLGLDKLTSCIFISEQFGCKKPDAAIFLAAAACLGYQAENILFIGDHPRNDILGARRVMMRTAWLHYQREWPAEFIATPPDYSIGAIEELAVLLNLVL